MSLLDPSAHKRIEAAIADVERRSSCEIVVAALPASDSYADLRLLYGIAFALAAAAGAHLAWPTLAVASLFWIEIAVLALSFPLLGLGPVLRVIVPRARVDESVTRRAREAFVERTLYATRDRTGVLIMISELEHRVVILGDSGIDAFVHANGWQGYVDRLVRAIREGRAADEICTLIADIGVVLAAHLPVAPDDVNELPNTVHTES
jgi:putative membrane protein